MLIYNYLSFVTEAAIFYNIYRSITLKYSLSYAFESLSGWNKNKM